MKKKCKNVDISNREFIRTAIHDCAKHKTMKELLTRPDAKRLEAECGGSEDKLIDIIQSEILNRHIVVDPIEYDVRRDKSNGKIRIIAIECIKQQIYDYIAYNSLGELAPYIGYYQIACKPKQGPVFGAAVMFSWLQETEVRIGRNGQKERVYTCTKMIKADLQRAYASIYHANMMEWLDRHVANDAILWLIATLLQTMDTGHPSQRFINEMERDPDLKTRLEESMKGLPIGSVLSIRLCALYVADVYHSNERKYITTRRGKKQNAVKHQMFNVDDIYLLGSNASQLAHAIRGDAAEFESKGMHLHDDWQMIDLNPRNTDAHVDVLGYKIYRDHITMRHRNYVKTIRAINTFNRKPTVRHARQLSSYSGLFIDHSNSLRFCRKYNYFKISKKARKVISQHDKSIIQRETARSQNDAGGRY